jgi:hypothetical protein
VLCIPFSHFAYEVDRAIRDNTSPNTGPDYDEGERPEALIASIAKISTDLAGKVIQFMERVDDEAREFYSYNLEFSSRLDRESYKRWKRLEEIIRHEARFFGNETRQLLEELFGGVLVFEGGRAVRSLENDEIYRARLERADGQADLIFKSPETELRAPPRHAATAGRMNAAGVRVFYGALRKDIAVAEIRPPLDSRVVVGQFLPTRRLKVLDVGGLQGTISFSEMFDPQFTERMRQLDLLLDLELDISRPVQPYDEAATYLRTQVVAEYLHHVLGLDGMAYRSAQIGRGGYGINTEGRLDPTARNVVLFGQAALTQDERDETNPTPGLRFVPGSAEMLDITRISFEFEKNMWAHYVDPQPDDEDS